jgi:hypothetical protein
MVMALRDPSSEGEEVGDRGRRDEQDRAIEDQDEGFTANLPGSAQDDDRDRHVPSGNVDQARPYQGSDAPDFAFDPDEGA